MLVTHSRSVQMALMGLALLAALTARPCLADKADDILRMAIKAEGTVSMRARVEICMFREGLQASCHVQRIITGPGNRKRTEVLSPATHAGGLVVSDGQTEWEYRPRLRLVRQSKVPPLAEILRDKLSALDLVRDTLHARYLGTETVAGRKCHVVSLSPPDGQQVRKKIWIDVETHTELRWERYNSQGKVSVRWAVTFVDFTSPPPASLFRFQPPPGCQVKQVPEVKWLDLEVAEQRIRFRAMVPRYIPPGYAFRRDHVAVTEFGSQPALWLQFTNGVDTFSIFQSRKVSPPPARSRRAHYWEAGGFSFLLVGRLPAAEVAKLVSSMGVNLPKH